MHTVITTPAASLDSAADSRDMGPDLKDEAGKPDGTAGPRSNTSRLGRHVPARDLHAGDVMQQFDWPLHVCEVDVGGAAVTVTVTEFGFQLHYAADEQVQLAA